MASNKCVWTYVVFLSGGSMYSNPKNSCRLQCFQNATSLMFQPYFLGFRCCSVSFAGVQCRCPNTHLEIPMGIHKKPPEQGLGDATTDLVENSFVPWGRPGRAKEDLQISINDPLHKIFIIAWWCHQPML